MPRQNLNQLPRDEALRRLANTAQEAINLVIENPDMAEQARWMVSAKLKRLISGTTEQQTKEN